MSILFFFSSRRRHTRFSRDWSSDVCSSDLSFAWQLAKLLQVSSAGETRVKSDSNEDKAGSTWIALPPGPHYNKISHRPRRARSEERRVGKECRSRWSACQERRNRKSERESE